MARLCTFTISIEVDEDFTDSDAQKHCDDLEHLLASSFYINDASYELEEE